MHHVLTLSILTALLLLLSACGGGSSSSGGSEVVASTKYSGSFQTDLYNGTINIELPANARPIVTLTGVECLTEPFSERMQTEILAGDIRLVGGSITELTVPGNFSVTFPNAGGEGKMTLGLSRDIRCRGASVGTLSVARS